MELKYCPVCDETITFAAGPKTSKILLLGFEPDADSMKIYMPFQGYTQMIFAGEFGNVGLDTRQMRRTYLWRHPAVTVEEDDKNPCLDWMMQSVLKTTADKEAILLIGAKAVKFFTGLGVADTCGMPVTSQYLDNPFIMSCVDPGSTFHAGIGEFRLAVTRFSNYIREKGLL